MAPGRSLKESAIQCPAPGFWTYSVEMQSSSQNVLSFRYETQSSAQLIRYAASRHPINRRTQALIRQPMIRFDAIARVRIDGEYARCIRCMWNVWEGGPASRRASAARTAESISRVSPF
jgi:hypothetical protein